MMLQRYAKDFIILPDALSFLVPVPHLPPLPSNLPTQHCISITHPKVDNMPP